MSNQLTAVERIKQSIQGKEYLTCKDLINLGICNSNSGLHSWRERNFGPPYISLQGSYIYPVPELISWLESRYVVPKNRSKASVNKSEVISEPNP
jgi:hypothetical protein